MTAGPRPTRKQRATRKSTKQSQPETNADLSSPRSSMSVMMASSEATPFAKTGGLGEIIGSLPKALERVGVSVSIVIPAYRSVLQSGIPLEDTGIQFNVPVSDRTEKGTLLRTTIAEGVTVYFVRADKYFDRDNLYGTPDGDYPDNAERFVFFSRAVLEVARLFPPLILHAHDWQTAMSVVFLKAQPELYPELTLTKTVLTVHNLGYQGVFWQLDWHLLNLDPALFNHHQLEFHGKINFLKGGLVFADAINTVSPTYSGEIKTPGHGFGLEGIFQERSKALTGILNGADYSVWNPKADSLLLRRYSTEDLSGKEACKHDLQKLFGIKENPEVPLVAMLSRLTVQKGCDLLERAMDDILSRDIQFVLLGTGDRKYQDFFAALPAQYPGQVGIRIDYDDVLAHKIIAGSDMFLMPSQYEPSGLTQIYSMKYGTVPIVRATGGLKDTVDEFNPKTGWGTGFTFTPYEVPDLLEAIDRALTWFRRDEWMLIVRNAMAADFSWDCSARYYFNLYKKLQKPSV